MRIVCDHELWPIEKVIPYHANIKKHPEAQINKLASMIQEYGFDVPMVCDAAGVLIKGHGRLEAAKKLGLTEVPVIVRTDLSPAQVKAARIADNKVAESEWDLDNLKLEMGELDALEFDLDLTGFDDDEQEKLLAEPMGDGGGLTDPDAVPENVETRCKPGDLWELGRHRLLCGDSTNVQHVERLMGSEKADMVFTDPPYGVDYEGVNNDHLKADALRDFVSSALALADATMKPGACYYVFHPDIHAYEFIGAIRDVGWVQARPAAVLWVKDSLVLGRGDYHSRSEPMLYGWKPGAGHLQLKDRSQDNVWEYPKPRAAEGHPTMKPVELVARAVGNSSRKGEVVYEPFAGGGSTLIACEKTGRRCFGMEIDPKYADVILKRWEDFTGKRATRIEE